MLLVQCLVPRLKVRLNTIKEGGYMDIEEGGTRLKDTEVDSNYGGFYWLNKKSGTCFGKVNKYDI